MKKNKLKDISSTSSIISNFAGRPARIILVGLSVIAILFPLYWLITNSFKMSQEYIANPPVMFPSSWVFDNYIEVFSRDSIGKYILMTIIISVLTTVITVLIGSMAGYAVARGPFGKRARNIFGLWFLIQKMYPAIATAIPIFLVMRSLRLIDTMTALVIMNTSFNLPLVIWLMMGFFQQLPRELEESGMIDGCNFYSRYFRIILPIVKPGLIASAILTFVATWNEFLFAVILSIKETKTLPVVIAGFITDRGLAWGPMAATAVITLVPVVLLVWMIQRDFVEGLAMGAVKG